METLGYPEFRGGAGLPAEECTFTLGFAALHDLIPAVVGPCTSDETHNPDNGDGLQATANGLLVWRKDDNWTAFTDGSSTWINGPCGLQSRANEDRFSWEQGGDCPARPPAAGPIVAMGVYVGLNASSYAFGEHPTATVTNNGRSRIIPLQDFDRGADCSHFWPVTMERLGTDDTWTRVLPPWVSSCVATADSALCLPGKSFSETIDLDLPPGTYRVAFPLQDYDTRAEGVAYSAEVAVK